MGMFDGILGGVVGAEMATVVNGLIQKHGGVQGIVAQLEQQGLGGTVRSWVGTGANQAITPDQIHQAFGSDTVKELAALEGVLSGSSGGANVFASLQIARRLGPGKRVITVIPDSAERYLSKKIFDGGI